MERAAPYLGRRPALARVVRQVAVLGLLPFALLLCVASCTPHPAATADAGPGAPGGDPRVDRERVVLRGATLDALGEDGGSSSLSARRLVVRHRTGGGGLLFYHDVTELAAEDAEITVRGDAGDGAALARVLEGVKRLFRSAPAGDPPPSLASGSGGAYGRVVFESLAIRVLGSAGDQLRLSATRGRLSFDPELLLLDGRIEMTTSLGEELRSPRAAFSRDFDGIHLPAGYEIGGRSFAKGALVVGSEGRLAPAAEVAEVRLDDRLERAETRILGRLVDRASRELRPLILALLASRVPGDSHQP